MNEVHAERFMVGIGSLTTITMFTIVSIVYLPAIVFLVFYFLLSYCVGYVVCKAFDF